MARTSTPPQRSNTRSVREPRWPSSVLTHWLAHKPVSSSIENCHSRAVPSMDAVASRRLPSGHQRAATRGPPCPLRMNKHAPAGASHTRAVPSSDAVATCNTMRYGWNSGFAEAPYNSNGWESGFS